MKVRYWNFVSPNTKDAALLIYKRGGICEIHFESVQLKVSNLKAALKTLKIMGLQRWKKA